MSTFGIHVLSDAAYAALKAAGHDAETFAVSESDKLLTAAKAKFPALVADISKGIADLKDSTLSGGDKAVKVATDVLATAPDVIAALPDAKDFLVSMVTSVYKDGLTALEGAATDALAKLLAVV